MAIVKINPILKSLIPDFLDNRKADINAIHSALGQQDYEAIRITGHNLRGCGSGYGFVPITELGETIEQAAIQQDNAVIQQATSELSNYLENVEPVYD
jgi:HPt (histidine-containing phosphotransfer) domain-containing protein